MNQKPSLRLSTSPLTKRVPQNQGKLWDLLALLAKLKKSRFPCFLVQKISNECQGPPVLLCNIVHYARILSEWLDSANCDIVARSDSIIMLLLSYRRGGCSSLLGMLLMMALLVHPCLLTRMWVILLLVGENVWPGEHLALSTLPARRLEG